MSVDSEWTSTIFEFNERRAMEYELTLKELLVLHWLSSFSHTKKMKFHIEHGEIYYWISYKKLLSDHPMLGTERSISLMFTDMCRSPKNRPDLSPILSRWMEKGIVFGTKTYYAFNQDGYGYLLGMGSEDSADKQPDNDEDNEDSESNNLSESNNPETVPSNNSFLPKTPMNVHRDLKKNKPSVKDISPQTRKILTEVLQKGSPFAAHKINEPGTVPSKTLSDVDRVLKALHRGTFLDSYPLDEKWARRVDLAELTSLKDDWGQIEDRVFDAAQAYKDWKKSSPELVLTNSFKDFLYNPRTKKSLFLSCLNHEHSQSGFASKHIQEDLQLFATKALHELQGIKTQRPAWNSFVYWKAMKSVVDYLLDNWTSLTVMNQWDYPGVHKIIENYGVYLLKTTSADPNYMAIGQYHWENFAEDFYEEMGFDVWPETLQNEIRKGA